MGSRKFAALFFVLLIVTGASADLFTTILWGAGAAGAVAVGGPFALAAIGYGPTGIAGGSIAAAMMSSSAIASGGGVAAGGVVATLQAAGAAASVGYAVPAVAGAAAAGAKAVYDGINDD